MTIPKSIERVAICVSRSDGRELSQARLTAQVKVAKARVQGLQGRYGGEAEAPGRTKQ